MSAVRYMQQRGIDVSDGRPTRILWSSFFRIDRYPLHEQLQHEKLRCHSVLGVVLFECAST